MSSDFRNVDASALNAAQGVSITGSTSANTITGGAGNDVIDGGGGADLIDAGAGNDTVHYYGTEVLIDGGFGSNTLVLDNPVGSPGSISASRRGQIKPRAIASTSPISRISMQAS